MGRRALPSRGRGVRLRRVAVGRSGKRQGAALRPPVGDPKSRPEIGSKGVRLRQRARRRAVGGSQRGRLADGPDDRASSRAGAVRVRLRRGAPGRGAKEVGKDAGLRLRLGGSIAADRVVRGRGLRHADRGRATRGIVPGAEGSGTRSPLGGGREAVDRGEPPEMEAPLEVIHVDVSFFFFTKRTN